MKQNRNIMVDIETIGKVQDATIFQIAAASFDIVTGDIISTIDLKLDVRSVEDFQADGDTLLWWLNENKELLTRLMNEGKLTEPTFYREFSDWLTDQALDAVKDGQQPELAMWGNGISFDIVRLRNKYDKHNMPFIISFRNEMDVRTILELASDKTGIPKAQLKLMATDDSETKHDALDDVRYQVRLVSQAYNMLMSH